jgi:hypothetical protein
LHPDIQRQLKELYTADRLINQQHSGGGLNRFIYQGTGVGGSGSGSTINTGGATHEGYASSTGHLVGSSAHLVDAYESELTRRRISDDFESPNPSGDDGCDDDQMMTSPPLEPLDAPFENREDSTCYN